MKTIKNFHDIQKIDRWKMGQAIADLPDQFLKAKRTAEKEIKVPEEFKSIEKIIIAGMGGSGIAGEIIRVLTQKQLNLPLQIIHEWHLPPHIDHKTLVIVVSFSGQTRETLTCLKEAETRKAKVFVVTKRKDLVSHRSGFVFDYAIEARAALGFLIMPILVLFQKLEFINLEEMAIEESCQVLKKFNQKFLPEVETQKNPAKMLAFSLYNYLPYIMAPEKYRAIAKRIKTQINENAKTFAVFETLPEATHHTIESYFPEVLKDEIQFLILEDEQIDPETKTTIKIFKQWLTRNNLKFEVISALKGGPFIRLTSLILIGDWISFYLGILYQIDPTETKEIKWFKKQYAKERRKTRTSKNCPGNAQGLFRK